MDFVCSFRSARARDLETTVNTLISKNLNIAVLGAGESGVAAARLLAAEGANVTVLDSAPEDVLRAEKGVLAENGINLLGGDAAHRLNERFAWGVLSPGIDPSAFLVKQFEEAGIPLVGELEFAFQRCAAPVVAITGRQQQLNLSRQYSMEPAFQRLHAETLALHFRQRLQKVRDSQQ